MKTINMIAFDIGAGSGRVFLSSYDGKSIEKEDLPHEVNTVKNAGMRSRSKKRGYNGTMENY